MGKKSGTKSYTKPFSYQEEGSDEENVNDPELEAELAALKAIRAEKENLSSPENSTYNKEGLLKCIADLETTDLPFVQTLEVSEFELPETNELDDMEREMNFYNHALMAAKSGRNNLESLGLPVKRPNDYFCEQVKSDAHMSRIKDRLLLEEKRIEAFEQRKNREQNRKFNKQLSLMKKQEQSKGEREVLNEINKIKQNRDANSKEEKLERILSTPQQSKKRKAMDKKYGYGGKGAKRAKINDQKSLNDTKDFNPRGGKFIRRTSSSAKGKKGNNRPGKEARSKARTARKSK